MSESRDLGPLFQGFISALGERIATEVCARLPSAGAPAQRLLTMEGAAQYLGRTVNAVRCMEKSGKLPVVRADGRVQFDIRDLDKWINDNKTE